MKIQAPFGTWESPITAEFVAGKDRSLTPNLQVDGDDLYFIESRPDEGGRQVLMRRTKAGVVAAAIPDEFNVRTRYLEYGGSNFLVHCGELFFINFKDQQIYRSRFGERPVPLTNDPHSRFADLSYDAKRKKLLALRELSAQPESKNSICFIDLATGEIKDLVHGCDFYNSPRLNNDGTKLLWLSWNHPNMAWNGTELWIGDIAQDGTISNQRTIAGDSSHGVCQPQWINSNDILFVAELENWFNLYRYENGSIRNIYPLDAEFAYPDWTPGQKQFGVSGNAICASFLSDGSARLVFFNGSSPRLLPNTFGSISSITAGVDGFFALATYGDKAPVIIHVNLMGELTDIYASYQLNFTESMISVPRAITFPTEDRERGHAWFYEPKNEKFSGMTGEKPPLIVTCHGGPTAISTGDFKKSFQFWTSRGYAVVDVNYGGSTGYGRKYRERLRGQWGIVDVSDCASVVQQLAKEGAIDPKRVAIRGGSAGGYTTLAALTFTKSVFSVGASYYGVSDLERLAKETHKLESRYLDQLIGPYPAALDRYKARSPLEHVQQLNCPIVFFQGDEDKVVPPNQSQLMHDLLKSKGIFSEYHLYQGEGHGFRRADTLQHSLKAEHGFYAKCFGFAVASGDRI